MEAVEASNELTGISKYTMQQHVFVCFHDWIAHLAQAIPW
jgi:hypothetical protein